MSEQKYSPDSFVKTLSNEDLVVLSKELLSWKVKGVIEPNSKVSHHARKIREEIEIDLANAINVVTSAVKYEVMQRFVNQIENQK